MDQEKKELLVNLTKTLRFSDELSLCQTVSGNDCEDKCESCPYENERTFNKTIQALEEAING